MGYRLPSGRITTKTCSPKQVEYARDETQQKPPRKRYKAKTSNSHHSEKGYAHQTILEFSSAFLLKK
jgi:hypothetical protein